MNKEFNIRPLTSEEKQRLESGISFDELSIIFFILLLTILNCSFIYVIYKSDSILLSIVSIAFIIGACVFFIPIVKEIISNRKYAYMQLKKNEKYCNKGYVNTKWFVAQKSVMYTIHSFFVEINDKKYQISEENYNDINQGDYVYYEVQEPLYTELKRIEKYDEK